MRSTVVRVAVAEAVSMGTVVSVRVAVARGVAWPSLGSFTKGNIIKGLLAIKTVFRAWVVLGVRLWKMICFLFYIHYTTCCWCRSLSESYIKWPFFMKGCSSRGWRLVQSGVRQSNGVGRWGTSYLKTRNYIWWDNVKNDSILTILIKTKTEVTLIMSH